MLVLSRRNGQEIRVGENIRIVLIEAEHGKCLIGIDAPKEAKVYRAEAKPPKNAPIVLPEAA